MPQHTDLPKNLAGFFWFFLRKRRNSFLGMIFLLVLMALYTPLSSYVLKILIDTVTDYGSDNGGLWQAVMMPAAIYIFLMLFVEIIWRIFDYLALKMFPALKADITLTLFDYVEQHAYSYFQQNFSGSLANKISDMAKGFESVMMQLMEPFILQSLSFIFTAASMYLIHPYFAFGLIIWAILFFSMVGFLSKKTYSMATRFSEIRSLSVGKVVDSITNIINVKLFANSRFENEYLNRYLDETARKDQKLQWEMLKLKIIQGLSITAFLGGMIAFLIEARIRNEVTVGDFVFIINAAVSISWGLWYLATHLIDFTQDFGMCRQALTLINLPHEITDIPDAKSLKISKGEIVFDRVHFHYVKGHNIFEDKTIVIPGGQKVGLVGFSGSGKSTFVSLILRFFDVKSGRILLDGQNIAEVSQQTLRANIAMIPQDPLLFHRSLMENIRYGRLDATDEEIIEASKKAHCHEFIVSMEGGYHALVGERGVKLSGGQRQRIAIARAIVKNAPILILDEATSALDSITEKKIKDSLSYLMERRTTLVIAHRLSTLVDMDRILVFEKGHIVEDGTHQELMNSESYYARLWNMQAGGFLVEDWEEQEEENSL